MLRWIRTCFVAALIGVMSVWATLAIFYAAPGGRSAQWVMAIIFAGLSAAAWALPRFRKSRGLQFAWGFLFLTVMIGLAAIQPSHQRDWRTDVAVLPRVMVEGDRARISGYRDFRYRGREDLDVRYLDREVDLSNLSGVDLFISYWQDGPMAHTFLTFRFENAPPVCVSIEARPEKNERFAPVRSLFKRYELIYVVGDERDIVGVRARHRGEEVYLYPIRVSAEAARRLFLIYARQINQLADDPEFYHLLSNSCTANLIRNAEAAGQKMPNFEGRFILNGWVDRYLHEVGLVDQSVTFEELRRTARITEKAKAARDENFSEDIRKTATASK